MLLMSIHAKRCLPSRANDVVCDSDVHCVNDVVPSAQWANITSLRACICVANDEQHHYAEHNITFASAKTSLTEKERAIRDLNRFVLSFCLH